MQKEPSGNQESDKNLFSWNNEDMYRAAKEKLSKFLNMSPAPYR